MTFPTIWRCAGDFQGFTEVQNGRRGSTSIFLWARKLAKFVWSLFLKFCHHIPSSMGMCKLFLKMLPKFKMAARGHLNFFVGAKTLQISQKLFTFYNHIPHDMEMCR